jgi:hypothetical protein
MHFGTASDNEPELDDLDMMMDESFDEAEGSPCSRLPTNQAPARRNKRAREEDPEAGAGGEAGRKAKRTYVPKYRSAPYALLIALLNQAEGPAGDDGQSRDATKSELLDLAQPLCDAPLARPSTQGSFYTGWSSMASLIQRGYITKKGRPLKFSLTESGIEFAQSLRTALAAEGDGANLDATRTQPGHRQPREPNQPKPAPNGSVHSGSDTFHYVFLAPDGSQVDSKDDAHVVVAKGKLIKFHSKKFSLLKLSDCGVLPFLPLQ